MRSLKLSFLLLCAGYLSMGNFGPLFGQSPMGTIVVKPKPFDGVLVNPDIGFTTFQRFNGDSLNVGTNWTEGFPIKYQPFHGTLETKDYPMTSIAYFRVYWRFVEPEQGVYNWGMLDKALQTAHERHQTLQLAIAPYGTGPESDVPAWYRKVTGEVLRKAPNPRGLSSSW
ncbi:MAG TPA: beta-galactosidase, partial [Acidobacteriaceae bacterium]|nr:beta-galactosidase [Acidobacteriaceae bacterium]